MDWSTEERQLQQLYGLDEAQLRWRRWCISANCGGDEDVFAEEYPASAEEAFLSSGRPVFSQRALAAAYAAAPQPQRGMLVEGGPGLRFVTGEGEFLSLYDWPCAGRDYVIGIDVAAGIRGGDYSAMCVLEKRDLCCAAVWHGHLEPDLLAGEAVRLACFYNRALLAPELNNHGIALLGGLKRLHYGHVWRRGNSVSEQGFLTTAKSKPQIIGRLAAFIREDAARIRDRDTMAECMSYVYDARGHTNAQAGQHDDRVMALAIALFVADSGGRGPLLIEPDWQQAYGANQITGY